MTERGASALALALAAGAALAGCGAQDDAAAIGTGRWGTYEISVESRPAPPRTGNNEVVVAVTADRHQPVYDALVFLRAQSSAAWVQAIEDGHVGVYRRAVDFGRGGHAVLEVRLRHGDDETTLAFPVTILAPQ